MVARIPLTRNYIAFVDDEDFERVSRYRWSIAHGGNWLIYAVTGSSLVIEWHRRLHALVLQAPPRIIIDHRNGNPLDNRRKNLRLCSPAENSRNSIAPDIQGKSSKFKGVWRLGGKWIAQITCDGAKFRLGSFDTEDDAARVYDTAALDKFKEFALTNEMMGLFDGRSPREDRKARIAADHLLTKEEHFLRKRGHKGKGWIRRRDRDRKSPAGIHEAYESKGVIIHFPPGMKPEGATIYNA